MGAGAERAGAMMDGGEAQQRMVSGHWTAREGYHHSQRTWFAGIQFLDGVSRMSSDALSSLFKPARPSKHSHKEGEYPVRLNGTEVVMGPSGPEVAYVAPEALSTHRTQAGALTYRSHASAITHHTQVSALTHRSHHSQVVDELESPGLKL